MPFLQLLGYDVFNPMEVMPEFTTDIGTKKYVELFTTIEMYEQ